ncbi:RrF2 family transcriptional regulator [Actomonas aquatica]|uniref:Rrf2 family transcriptional regulator n=1 Tax=Actomonas aquatica TaxID=2866162 RepID=A0ABZ1C8B0_9BACT|nr:Rrf2 family transcriptional regulator [Opitutus sp. WL0086]WRQ87562.1 Rrf2 family transcriptional regulator [Opitutus sp. WL0086]
MKLSKKGEYGLRALIDLGMAAEVGPGLLQVAQIAAKEQIPVKFLEQILQSLREGGIVETQRGRFGGYRLAKPADRIGMGEVIRRIDGPLAPIGCVSQSAYEPCSCPDEVHCGLRMLMLDVRNAIAGILDRYTLGDVVEVTLRKMRRDGVVPDFGPAQPLRRQSSLKKSARLEPVEGLLHHLFSEPQSEESSS